MEDELSLEWARIIRGVALTGLGGLIAGLAVGGVGSRAVMRVSAVAAGPQAQGLLTEAGNRVGEITLSGTIELMIFGGLFSGAIGAVVVVMADPWLRWMRLLRWLGYGFLALAIAGSSIVSSSHRDFFLLDPPLLNVSMFISLFFAFGLVLQFSRYLLDRRLPRAEPEVQPGYVVVTALGLPFLLLLLATFFVPSFSDDSNTQYGIGVLVLALGLATVGHWISTAGSRPRWLRAGSAVVGYGSLGVLVAVGLPRLIDEVRKIL